MIKKNIDVVFLIKNSQNNNVNVRYFLGKDFSLAILMITKKNINAFVSPLEFLNIKKTDINYHLASTENISKKISKSFRKNSLVVGLDYENTDDYQLFEQMLLDKELLDYAYNVNNLSNLTYGEITSNGTESKVIIISKFTNSNDEILFYEDSIRSNWADSDDFDYVLNFLEDESVFVNSEDLYDRFRVMQAVTTMQMSGSGILKALMNWSLVNRAKSFNNYLIEYDEFEELLEELPIVMVDYANCNTKKFNENIMEIIMDFNQNS